MEREVPLTLFVSGLFSNSDIRLNIQYCDIVLTERVLVNENFLEL